MPRHLPTACIPLPADPTPPPQVWIIDNYRVHRWYYRDAPRVGDWVYYMDGDRTRIASVSRTRVLLTNSCSMRRPYLARRMWTWAEPRLRHGLTPIFIGRRPKATIKSHHGATVYV